MEQSQLRIDTRATFISLDLNHLPTQEGAVSIEEGHYYTSVIGWALGVFLVLLIIGVVFLAGHSQSQKHTKIIHNSSCILAWEWKVLRNIETCTHTVADTKTSVEYPQGVTFTVLGFTPCYVAAFIYFWMYLMQVVVTDFIYLIENLEKRSCIQAGTYNHPRMHAHALAAYRTALRHMARRRSLQ